MVQAISLLCRTLPEGYYIDSTLPVALEQGSFYSGKPLRLSSYNDGCQYHVSGDVLAANRKRSGQARV